MDKKKKSPRKSNAPKIIDLDVQQRKLAIIKQKQCDSIALNIVSKLIDCRVEEDVFLRSLKYLNQCHYQDIVEERAISKLCGYPVCGNEIKSMPTKKYHISTKSNKVYDITERKNYCSNFCYKAGKYIKEQMLTSPLWFRDQEEIPNFNLLPNTENGIPGEEIDQGIIKIDVEDEDNKNFTSISQFTQDVINDMPEEVYNKIDNNLQQPETKIEDKNCNIETNNYFSNIYGPSLADILKENAEYFEKNTGNNNEQKNTEKNKIEEIQNKTKNDYCEPSTSCKVGFDRTVINTNSQKGILKKSKRNSEKKRVSFSDENSVKEIQGIPGSKKVEEINKKFKRPEQNKESDKKEEKKYKNMNLIGVVQERSTIWKRKTDENELENIENFIVNSENKILDSENNLEINEVENKKLLELEETETKTEMEKEIKNLINSINSDDIKETVKNQISTTEHKNNEIEKNVEDTNTSIDSNKKSRLSRLKNSSTYKKSIFTKPKPTVLSKSNNSEHDFQTRLNNYVSEWFTFDTAVFLYGEEYVKKIMSDDDFKQYINKKKNLELDEKKQKQYEEICKRLNLFELADQKFDEKVTGKKRRPLPRYDTLRDQAEHMDLRVQAFYAGCYEMYEEDVTDTDTDVEADEEGKPQVVQGPPAVLPLVDNKDMMGMRRKIFQTSISRSISTICEVLQESPNRLLAELKHLINTFEFTASNIVFKTNEWSFVTLFLIQILSIKDKELQTSLTSKEATSYLDSLTQEFNISEENLLEKIKIRNLLDECMKKDCVT